MRLWARLRDGWRRALRPADIERELDEELKFALDELTERHRARGRTLEPIVAAIARWWVRHAMEDHVADVGPFTETSAQSILESLPFLLREQDARGADVTFEIRLSGAGGGVWTVRIAGGHCTVTRGFAEAADVRYTAEARVWCGVALGFLDARDAIKRGLLTKDGGRDALDHYFHQIPRPQPGDRPGAGRGRSRRRTP